MITTKIQITRSVNKHVEMSNGIITLLTAFEEEMMEGVGVKAKDEYEGKDTILLEREGFISV